MKFFFSCSHLDVIIYLFRRYGNRLFFIQQRTRDYTAVKQ